MERIIDNHAVEQHLVLDWRAASDIKLTALVASEDDTWNYLQILCEVGLSSHSRDSGNDFRSYVHDGSLSLGPCLDFVGSDVDSSKHHIRFFEIIFLV